MKKYLMSIPICTTGLILGVQIVSAHLSTQPLTSIELSHTLTSPQSTSSLIRRDIDQLKHHARLITARVWSGDVQGSGVLIQRKGHLYTLLTNAHVVQENQTLRIETFDHHNHTGSQQGTINLHGYDLKLLQFKTFKNYPIATPALDELNVGDEVFAAGFPSEGNGQRDAFKFTEGQVSLLLDEPIEGGYKVGYTNLIEKGMSGGPVLNVWGELVAINGMHAEALWGDPYIYMDGSKPCLPLREIMVESSWAIPMSTVREIAEPQLDLAGSPSPQMPLPPGDILLIDERKNLESTLRTLFLQFNATRAKHCIPRNSH